MHSPLSVNASAYASAERATSRTRQGALRLFAFVLLAGGSPAAQGATITVVNGNDSGAGSLRQAIFDASSGDSINFVLPQNVTEIRLTSGELLINKNLTINGPAAVRSEGQTFRIFRIAPASVTAAISRLTVSGGHPSTNEHGGGILNTGTLTINNSTITANTTHYDGSSNGGGIANTGTLTIANSTISGNSIFFFANFSGGGLANFGGGTLTITNSTISGNGRPDTGGCGGIFIEAGSAATARSTIIALNNGPTSPDVCGALASQGFNLVGNNAGAIIAPQPSDLIGTAGAPIDPLLGPLQYNGGPTFTRALQSNSPARNSGDPNAPTQDQRGYYRADISDIGAFEFGATVPVSLTNISTRLRVETGDNVLIGGFVITGTQPKKIIVRAIGPSLPLTEVLANPILELRNSSGGLVAINDDWRSDQEAEIIATTLQPNNDMESAIVITLPANNAAYTAIVRGVNNGTGIGIVEAYDLNRTVDSRLGNISTRGLVQTGDNVLIAGTIVVGQVSQKVIVRAIGPSLNLPGKLPNPTLELRDTNGGLLASNDDWRTDQEAEIIGTGLQPSNDLESAIVRTLAPSNYTAIVRGVNGATGIAVVEAYGLN